MKRREAACPSCGAPVPFEIGSVVAVCEFCQSAVGRGDKEVKDYGKVADLVDTSTRLRRGLTGKFNKKPFTVMGRVQYRHQAGGVWDEWYLALPGNKWGWLADAQGKTHLMFQRKLPRDFDLPEHEELSLDTMVRLGDNDFSVSESGVAEAIAAEGQIPWGFRSGQEHRYADLRSDDGTFATFEYGVGGPHVYVGKEVSLEDLELEGQGWHQEEEKIAVSAMQVNCPQCGGQLTLRAPDQTLRVTCQSCNSLLDAESGKLSYLKTVKSRLNVSMVIPLGAEGKLFGHTYTVIGFMQRYALYEGKMYPWFEYLLYEPEVGFRWLVHNDSHWSFVEPVSERMPSPKYKTTYIRHDGDSFRLYDRGRAHVRHVLGEFYWKVEAGDIVRTADYICPPRMLSYEWIDSSDYKEVTVSLGRYITVEELEKAFGLKRIPRAWGVGVIQPAPKLPDGVYWLWALFLLILAGTFIAFARKADPWLCFYAMLFVSSVPIGYFFFLWAYEAKRWEDSDYSPYASE